MVKKLFLNGSYFATIKYSQELYSNYKKHMHPTLSFGVVSSGTLEINFNSKAVKLTKDKIVCFNRFELHYSKNVDAKGYYSIYISDEWLKSKFKNIPICYNLIEFSNITKVVALAYESKDATALSKTIEDIILNYSKNKSSKTSKIVDSMLEYIYVNIKEKISIDTIAKELAYSKEYLIRTFKSQMGMTPHQFIVALKVDFSSQMLQASSCSITDVSLEYSFFDQSHYIKSFKSIYGISPKSYKKSIIYN